MGYNVTFTSIPYWDTYLHLYLYYDEENYELLSYYEHPTTLPRAFSNIVKIVAQDIEGDAELEFYFNNDVIGDGDRAEYELACDVEVTVNGKTVNLTGEIVEPEEPTEHIEVTYADKVFKLSAGQKIVFKGGRVTLADIVAKVVEAEAEAEDELAGTWVFDDEPDIFTSQTYNISFTSNNQTYSKLSCTYGGEVYFLNYDEMLAYFNQPSYEASGWEDEAYKTINITSKLAEVTNGDALLAWLKANATKQSASDETEYTLTISAKVSSSDSGNYAIKLNSAPTSNDDYDYKASDVGGNTYSMKAVSYYKWNVNNGSAWENVTPNILTSDTNITITWHGGGGAID